MTCVHKVRWSVKRPEDCRFRLSVSHYKDRIVAPDEYSGATEVTPSDSEQVLPTKDKLVRDDITINPAPTEVLSTDHNGTFTPSEGNVGFSQVNVDVASEVTYDDMASGTKPSGDITITVTEIVNLAFRDRTGITGVNAPNCTKIGNQAFMNDVNILFANLPIAEQIGDSAFAYTKLSSLVLPSIKTIGSNCFGWNVSLKNVVIGASCQSIGEGLLRNTSSGWVCKFLGIPTSLASRTFYNTQGGDIYVPWSEGTVSGAPWGATSATIHYDTVYDDDWNVISST